MKTIHKLKKILTIKETSDYLSEAWNDNVTESDVLQFALDHQLCLSVNFVNPEKARLGIIPMQNQTSNDGKNESHDFLNNMNIEHVIFENDIVSIEGVWDLMMIGDEKLDIQKKFQKLRGGIEIHKTSIKHPLNNNNIGTFLKNSEGKICQIQSHFGNENLITPDDLEEPWEHPANYWSVNQLPETAELVVRTSELLKLESKVEQANVINLEKPLSEAERDSLLKIIIGMAVKGYSYNPNAKKSEVPTEIHMDLEQLGINLDVDTIRKYLKLSAKKRPAFK